MQGLYKVYIEETLDLEEPWIRELFVSQISESVRFTNRYEETILFVTISSKKTKIELKESSLNLQFSGHNMSLFEDEQHDVFKFKTRDELLSLMSSIKEYILKSTYSLEADLLDTCNKLSRGIKTKIGDELFKTFEKQYLEILGLYDLNELSDYLRSHFPLFEVTFLYDIKEEDLNKNCYCLSQELKLYLLSDSEDETLLLLLVLSIKDFLNKITTVKDKFEVKDISHIFKSLPHAVTIFNKESNSYNHNTQFSKLSIPTRLLESFTDGQTLDLEDNGKFKVIKKTIDNKYLILSFIEIKDFEMNFSDESQEELGIVSSSIAHELNNPLGGILAALDVLLLDDNSDEIEEKFIQMKEGVQRCKELVETFLSFSRKEQLESDSTVSVRLIVDQVIQLSRFRLIESNNQLKINYTALNSNAYLKNSHLLTMCLYLIVGDLLTVRSRDSLIKQNALSDILSLDIIEDKNNLLIVMEQELSLSKEFLTSKLFNYILQILNIKLIEENKTKKLYFY